MCEEDQMREGQVIRKSNEKGSWVLCKVTEDQMVEGQMSEGQVKDTPHHPQFASAKISIHENNVQWKYLPYWRETQILNC